MPSLQRRAERALDEGVEALDRGYEQLARGHQREAARYARRALRHLRLARVLVRFTSDSDAPVADEIRRTTRLLGLVSGETRAPDSPASTVQVFDEYLDVGDEALRADDVPGAQTAYVIAYAALHSLLPSEAAAGLPTPRSSEVHASPDRDVPNEPGRCDLCWVETADGQVRFRDESVPACDRCTQFIGGRFPTTEDIYRRCERVLDDVLDVTETAHGLAWLSPPDPTDDEAAVEEESPPTSGPTPEQVHLALDLAAVSQHVGHPATPEDVREHGTYAPDEFRAAFGSWRAALREAGLTPEE